MKPKRRKWLYHYSETERKEGEILPASQSRRDGRKMPALMPLIYPSGCRGCDLNRAIAVHQKYTEDWICHIISTLKRIIPVFRYRFLRLFKAEWKVLQHMMPRSAPKLSRYSYARPRIKHLQDCLNHRVGTLENTVSLNWLPDALVVSLHWV